MGTPSYYVDLTVRSGVSVEEVLAEAKRQEADRQEAGFDQVALETAARLDFSNGAFEESEDEGASVVEEFYPEGNSVPGDPGFASEKSTAPSLADKLDDLMARLGSVG